MDYLSIGVFFTCGIVFTLITLSILGKIDKSKKAKNEQLQIRMKAEQDGWIKLDNHLPDDWRSRSDVKNWLDDKTEKLEIANWVLENIKGNFFVRYISGNHYIQFDNDEDAIAFKLWWK